MSNIYKFCGCKACRRGRKRGCGKTIIKSTQRKFRRQCKQKLSRGEEPDSKIGIPYTW